MTVIDVHTHMFTHKWLQLLPFVHGPIFNIYSFWGIVWVHLTTNLGVKVLLLAPAFRNMDAALEEWGRCPMKLLLFFFS